MAPGHTLYKYSGSGSQMGGKDWWAWRGGRGRRVTRGEESGVRWAGSRFRGNIPGGLTGLRACLDDSGGGGLDTIRACG